MHIKNNTFEIFGNILIIHLFQDKMFILKSIMINGVLNYYHLVKLRRSFYNIKYFILKNTKNQTKQ